MDAYDLAPEVVRERFDWAVRQGNPVWLWPDTRVADWQAALTEVGRVAREVLNEGCASQPLSGRPEDFGVAGYTSGMGPLLGFWLRQGLVQADAGVGAMLDLHYRHNAVRMDRLAQSATDVVGSLVRQGVTVVVLKGMDTAYSAFPDPATRPLSDIDLLIDPAERARADEVLLSLGYQPGRISENPSEQNWRLDPHALPRSLTFNHADDPWSVDLQTSMNRRYSYGAPMLELDAIRPTIRLEPWSLTPGAWKLPPEALVLHLACHASCGLESLSLLRIVELVMTIRARSECLKFGWGEVMALADKARATAMMYPALCLAERLAPGTVPDSVSAACRDEAPLAVRRVIGRFEPHNAQRVLRCSLEERFMWSPSRTRKLVQVIRELVPGKTPLLTLLWIYRMRMWRLLRGSLSR